MKSIVQTTKAITCLLVMFMLTMTTSCSKSELSEMEKEIRELEGKSIFSVDENAIVLDGVINSNALKAFDELYAKNTDVDEVRIKQCEGSINDVVNIKLSKRVHSLKLNTVLLDGATIASGGVDFFLSGVKRTAKGSFSIGVHSWSDGKREATDFPAGHKLHQGYIDMYKSFGFSAADAKAFYEFTIHAAKASEVHWMTASEIAKYHIFTTVK